MTDPTHIRPRPARTAGHGPTQGRNAGTRTDAVREHICQALRTYRTNAEARVRHAEALERADYTIVDGRLLHGDRWSIQDWRTSQLLAKGAGGVEAYNAAYERLNADGTWVDYDTVGDVLPADVLTPGVPSSLGSALEDWVGTPSTPDTEIAEFIGWSVTDVRAHRQYDN